MMSNNSGCKMMGSGQFDKEAILTRGWCVAKNATLRADRPDSLDFARDRLFATQKRIAQDDRQTD